MQIMSFHNWKSNQGTICAIVGIMTMHLTILQYTIFPYTEERKYHGNLGEQTLVTVGSVWKSGFKASTGKI